MAELEERVGRLERDHAGLEVRTVAMNQQLTSLSAFPMQIVRLEGALQSLREALADVRREVADVSEGVAARAKEQSEERRALKLALIGLTGVIVASVIGGVFLLLAQTP